jgi:hypothetical protein
VGSMLGWAAVVTALLPGALGQQEEPPPLSSRKADAELLRKLHEALPSGGAVQAGALVLAPLGGEEGQDGFILMPAAGSGAEGQNGRLLAVLFDGCHLEPANIVTVRILRPPGANWQTTRVSFSTLAAEGAKAPQRVHQPNASWTAALTPLVVVPEKVAAQLTLLGGMRYGATRAAYGVDVIFARTEGKRTAGVSFRLPSRSALAEHGVTWCANAAAG